MLRRFETRCQVARPIEIISAAWDEPLKFSIGDLSPRGTYVYSELMPDKGEHIHCAFDLGLSRPFEFFGEVARVNLLRRASDLGYPGFGVRFLDASPFERLTLRRLLRDRPPAVASPPRLIVPARHKLLH
jgi:hypothetical protein